MLPAFPCTVTRLDKAMARISPKGSTAPIFNGFCAEFAEKKNFLQKKLTIMKRFNIMTLRIRNTLFRHMFWVDYELAKDMVQFHSKEVRIDLGVEET